MKRILCYGDSNTWGHNPRNGERFEPSERWTGILQKQLGFDYEIIEEGLCGRTTVWEDPIEEHKNGKNYLFPCLDSHRPLDLAIIMLGTNDLKKRFSLSAFDIASGAGVLVNIVQKSDAGISGEAPEVLLLVPPRVKEGGEFNEAIEGAEEKSGKFSKYFNMVSDHYGCPLLDTQEIVTPSPLDGVHLDAGEHFKLGIAVADAVREIIG